MKATRRQDQGDEGCREEHLYDRNIAFFRLVAFGERVSCEDAKPFRGGWSKLRDIPESSHSRRKILTYSQIAVVLVERDEVHCHVAGCRSADDVPTSGSMRPAAVRGQ